MQRDHVVVGGGIYGSYLAWELAKADLDVLLIERNQVASESSGGPGKRGVRAGGRDPRELPLARIAYGRWSAIGEELSRDVGYDQVGQLEFIERSVPEIEPTSTRSAEAQVWLQRQYGIPSELLSAEETANMEPNVSNSVIGAVYTPKDGVIDHTAATRAVADAAKTEGATVLEEESVTSMERSSTGRIRTVVTSDGREVETSGTVSLLTNAGASDFLEATFDTSLPVWNVTPQVILTEPLDEVPFTHLVAHAHRTLAMKPTETRRVMITGGWPAKWGQDQRGHPVPDLIEKNVEQAVAVYPALADVTVDEVIADHQESCSIDGIPIIDRVPGIENLFVGTGWTGHGYAIAPAVCELLGQWISSGRRPELLEPFGIDRFTPTPDA